MTSLPSSLLLASLSGSPLHLLSLSLPMLSSLMISLLALRLVASSSSLLNHPLRLLLSLVFSGFRILDLLHPVVILVPHLGSSVVSPLPSLRLGLIYDLSEVLLLVFSLDDLQIHHFPHIAVILLVDLPLLLQLFVFELPPSASKADASNSFSLILGDILFPLLISPGSLLSLGLLFFFPPFLLLVVILSIDVCVLFEYSLIFLVVDLHESSEVEVQNILLHLVIETSCLLFASLNLLQVVGVIGEEAVATAGLLLVVELELIDNLGLQVSAHSTFVLVLHGQVPNSNVAGLEFHQSLVELLDHPLLVLV